MRTILQVEDRRNYAIKVSSLMKHIMYAFLSSAAILLMYGIPRCAISVMIASVASG